MRIEVIKTKLNKIISSYNYNIYSIKTKYEFGENILEILIDGKNITTNTLETIHSKLFEQLEDGDISDNYYLEISSRGAERSIDSLEDLKDQVGKYIYFTSSIYSGNANLLEVDNDGLCLISVNLKGRIKKIKIKYEELNQLRLAVKV